MRCSNAPGRRDSVATSASAVWSEATESSRSGLSALRPACVPKRVYQEQENVKGSRISGGLEQSDRKKLQAALRAACLKTPDVEEGSLPAQPSAVKIGRAQPLVPARVLRSRRN